MNHYEDTPTPPLPPAWMFVGVTFGRERSLRRRIHSIARGPAPRRRWSLAGLLLLLAVGCATLTDKQKPAAQTTPAPATADATMPPDSSPRGIPGATGAPGAPRGESEAAAATRQKMIQSIDVRYTDEPLASAIDDIARKGGVKIVPDWAAIEAAGVRPDTRITVAWLNPVATARALRLVLDRASGEPAKFEVRIDRSGDVIVSTPQALPRLSPADQTRNKMMHLVDAHFDQLPLEQAIERLREQSGVALAPNWRSLEMAGIPRDKPITMHMVRMPLELTLPLLLRHASRGSDSALGYHIDEFGVINIAAADALARNTIIKSYDIRDLLVIPPRFEAYDPGDPRKLSEPADAPAAPPAQPTREELTTQIMDLIRNTIDPANWREAGGHTSSMSQLNGTLIVNTTERNHDAIARLLAQIRAPRALQYHVRATVLLVDEALYQQQVLPLLKPRRKGDSGQAALPTAQEVERLLEAVAADRQSLRLTAPAVTAFNGQRAQVTTGRETPYIVDYERDEAGKLQPQTRVYWEGVLLDVEGAVSADRKHLTTTARIRVQRNTRVREVAYPAAPPDQPLMLQVPEVMASFLSTTASVPDKATLLLAGGTIDGNPLQPDSPDRAQRHVVALIATQILDPAKARPPMTPGVPQEANPFR